MIRQKSSYILNNKLVGNQKLDKRNPKVGIICRIAEISFCDTIATVIALSWNDNIHPDSKIQYCSLSIRIQDSIRDELEDANFRGSFVPWIPVTVVLGSIPIVAVEEVEETNE